MKLTFPPWKSRKAKLAEQRKKEILAKRESLRRFGGSIAPNVQRQGQERDFGDFVKDLQLQEIDSVVPSRIAHIVNAFTQGGAYDAIQTATLESIRRAKRESVTGHLVGLVQVPSESDLSNCPDGFTPSRPLTRDVRDVGTFLRPRPLPLFWDILERGVEAAGDAEFIIYSNADICLQPHFYDTVNTLLSAGIDAITINRRTLSMEALGYPSHLVSSETGTNHEGYDCFVFKRSLFDHFVRSDCCLGVAFVDRSLLFNLVAHSERMLIVENAALTYHFGNEKAWKDPELADYQRFNENEQMATLKELCGQKTPRERLLPFCFNRQEPKATRAYLKEEFGANPADALNLK